MGRKKRDYVEKHKLGLGEVLEAPETYGVRVRRALRSRPWNCTLVLGSRVGTAASLFGCAPRRRSRGLASGEKRRRRRPRTRRRTRSLCRRPCRGASCARRARSRRSSTRRRRRWVRPAARCKDWMLHGQACRLAHRPAVCLVPTGALQLGAGRGLTAAAPSLDDSDSEDDLSGAPRHGWLAARRTCLPAGLAARRATHSG